MCSSLVVFTMFALSDLRLVLEVFWDVNRVKNNCPVAGAINTMLHIFLGIPWKQCCNRVMTRVTYQ